MTKDFLKAELRSGNTDCSTGAVDFLNPLLEHCNQTVPISAILVRADSGFAAPYLYDLCEEKERPYVIRLKQNPRLLKMAEKFVQVGDETEWSQREKYFHSIRYQAGTWKHDRRVCICSIREASELIFHHEFIITNLLDAIPAKQVYQTHWKRCTMDNFIKEAKNGFFFDKSDSSHDGHRTFLWHKQFYAHASISKKGQRSTDTDYPSSFFQNCWETDPQRKTHDAKTQHPPCLPRRFFSDPTANSIFFVVRPR